jgi:hypothetical protein
MKLFSYKDASVRTKLIVPLICLLLIWGLTGSPFAVLLAAMAVWFFRGSADTRKKLIVPFVSLLLIWVLFIPPRKLLDTGNLLSFYSYAPSFRCLGATIRDWLALFVVLLAGMVVWFLRKDAAMRRQLVAPLVYLPLIWAVLIPVEHFKWEDSYGRAAGVGFLYPWCVFHFSGLPAYFLTPPYAAYLLMALLGGFLFRSLEGARAFILVYWLINMFFILIVVYAIAWYVSLYI